MVDHIVVEALFEGVIGDKRAQDCAEQDDERPAQVGPDGEEGRKGVGLTHERTQRLRFLLRDVLPPTQDGEEEKPTAHHAEDLHKKA